MCVSLVNGGNIVTRQQMTNMDPFSSDLAITMEIPRKQSSQGKPTLLATDAEEDTRLKETSMHILSAGGLTIPRNIISSSLCFLVFWH